jgi:hypothetical protein
MQDAPAPRSEGAVVVVADSPLSPKSIAAGKTAPRREDGSCFATGGANAQALLRMMAAPEGITTLDLWPRRADEPGIATRFGSVLYQHRTRFGLTVDTLHEPNVTRPRRHGVYLLREHLTVVGSG